MKIPNLKIMIASVLLLIPMSCMQFGDGHGHLSGFHHYAPPPQSPAYYPGSGCMTDPAEIMGANKVAQIPFVITPTI